MTFPVPDVAESWNRIRTWLAAHAPGVLAKIRQPASGADIAAAQEVVGVPLPEDLVALWRLADGVANVWPHVGHLLPPWFDPYPVATAVRRRETWIEVWHDEEARFGGVPYGQGVREVMEWAGGSLPTIEEQVAEFMAQPAGTPCEGMYLPIWLPVAGSGMGLDLFVDLRRGPLRGCVMRFDRVGTAQLEPDWPSVAAMLADVAGAFEHGLAIGDRHPVRASVDEEGFLVWD
jgi:cell wall assembly regulator SMI1